MVNATLKSCLAVLLLAALVLGIGAALRGAEYDEQYTLFLTAGVARPVWPAQPFAAGDVRAVQAGHASLGAIARDLRASDVHPPLYFWAVAAWRWLIGSSLFAARLFSVSCSLASLAAVAVIARRLAMPPALAMLLTLGCYGFAYTGMIARGFALAQALSLCGVAMLLAAKRGRVPGLSAGLLLGAATFANYLAVFVMVGMLLARCRTCSEPRRLAPTPPPHAAGAEAAATEAAGTGPAATEPCGVVWSILGCMPFLLADLWFFLPQRGARSGQFPSFHLLDALRRLAYYAAANLFGGLPLYVDTGMRPAIAAMLAVLVLAGAALVAARWRRIADPAARGALLAAVAAPPSGLLVLGLLFDNSPIELRYLAFATPFAALLLTGAIASLSHRQRHAAIAVLLSVQTAALVGLLTRPETMQPARATAAAASRLGADGVVVLPRGNDGVGIVGAVAIESPPAQRLLVVDRTTAAAQILARIGGARRVVLALLAQDDASRATLPAMRAAMTGPCWRRIADGFNVIAFDRICEGDAAWHSSTALR